MAQINFDWPVSLSLLGLPTGQKRKGQRPSASAQLYSHSCGAQVALQRCPILRTSTTSLPYPFPILRKRGHLYFAKKGTFLLWVDITGLTDMRKKEEWGIGNLASARSGDRITAIPL
jgi:hypothetical protein